MVIQERLKTLQGSSEENRTLPLRQRNQCLPWELNEGPTKPEVSGVTEVRSKILTPLETTGGNSFSLEGYVNMLFTIQNFTQGVLHSTGGIQVSFLGVIIPLEGFRYPS